MKRGQGDALTTDNGILYGMREQDKNYIETGGTATKEPYGIAINKGQKPFEKAVNKAKKQQKQNGTYAKLKKKWAGDVPGASLKEVE